MEKEKKKSNIKIIFLILVVMVVIVGIIILENNLKNQENLQIEKDNLMNHIEYQLNNEGGMGYVENTLILHNNIKHKDFDIIWKYTNGGESINKLDSSEAVELKGEGSLNIDYIIKDDTGNMLSFNDAVQKYMQSDYFKNKKIEYDKEYEQWKEEVEKLKNNQDLITEEYKNKNNDAIYMWDLYAQEYDMYKNFCENPTEYNYQELKSKIEQIKNEIENSEAYKNFQLHKQYPNLY